MEEKNKTTVLIELGVETREKERVQLKKDGARNAGHRPYSPHFRNLNGQWRDGDPISSSWYGLH